MPGTALPRLNSLTNTAPSGLEHETSKTREKNIAPTSGFLVRLQINLLL